jgi:AcrR family transcriptional regulator
LRESTWVAIVDAAESVGASGGLGAMTLQAIAHEAGIAVGTIYNYFVDRNELIEALFARRREELYLAVDDAVKKHASASFEAQLDTFVRAVLRYFDTRRTFLRLALEAHEQQVRTVKASERKKAPTMEQLKAHAERLVKLGTKEKKLRDEGSHLFAISLVAVLKGVLIARADAETSLESETQAIVAIFLRGVAR